MNKLSERKTMTLNLPAAEMDVLEGLAGEQELTKTQIMRQALKLYQLVTVKARDGHHMMFSGEPPMAAAHVVGVGLPLLNAARSEALSSPGGQGNTEAQGCGTDGAVSCRGCQPESPASAAEAVSPVCRVCGKPDDVGCYWPDRPELTICVTCCETAEHADGETGHVWEYERAEQDRVCQHCGQFARNTDFYLHWDQP